MGSTEGLNNTGVNWCMYINIYTCVCRRVEPFSVKGILAISLKVLSYRKSELFHNAQVKNLIQHENAREVGLRAGSHLSTDKENRKKFAEDAVLMPYKQYTV